MQSITANGIFINAIRYDHEKISISVDEAKRLLKNGSAHFSILMCIDGKDVTVNNIEDLRTSQNADYVIQNAKIENVMKADDLEYMLHELGWQAINSMIPELKRVGRPVGFHELDGHFSSFYLKDAGSLFLQEDEVMIDIFRPGHRDMKLSSFLNDDSIKVDELISIVRELKHVYVLTAKQVETCAHYNVIKHCTIGAKYMISSLVGSCQYSF